MTTTETMEFGANCRVRVVHDESHETIGSYAYGTDSETEQAEQDELRKLNSGEWVAVGMIVETLTPHCEHCHRPEEWMHRDSLWSIVIEPDENTMRDFARFNLDLPADVPLDLRSVEV